METLQEQVVPLLDQYEKALQRLERIYKRVEEKNLEKK